MIDAEKTPLAPRYDVAVIGGGTAGCAAAMHLALTGKRVALFEQRLAGAQASGQNYGGVRQQGRVPEELPLSFRARAIWDRLPALLGHDCGFHASGHIKLARTAEEFADLEAWAAMAKGFGLDVQLLTGNRLRAEHAYLGSWVYGGSHCATDGHANPRLVGPLFARAAERAGADVRECCPVAKLEREGAGFRLTLADGRSTTADAALNTAGAWGADLAAQIGETYDERVMSPNMVVTEPIAPIFAASFGVCGGDIYFRQTPRGNVVFGGGRGTADKSRLWSRPLATVSAGAAAKMTAFIPAVAHAAVIRSWSGIDGAMPDDRPVLGQSPTTPGLFHAFGFSGHGFQLGPAVGEVLAELVLKGGTETDVSGLSLTRFLPGRAGAA